MYHPCVYVYKVTCTSYARSITRSFLRVSDIVLNVPHVMNVTLVGWVRITLCVIRLLAFVGNLCLLLHIYVVRSCSRATRRNINCLRCTFPGKTHVRDMYTNIKTKKRNLI